MDHISDQMKADDEFHLAYGRALSEWATIEQRLFFWFLFITQMRPDLGRSIFYSARNFNGRMDMLEAAMGKAALDQATSYFLKAAFRKARQFSSFRNNLAHGETMFDGRPDSPYYLKTYLVDGKRNDGSVDAVATGDTLETARNNFRELSRIIMDGLMIAQGDHSCSSSLEICRQQVLALPSEADSPIPN